jgi:3-oxoacyl-[acyl-carrier-protein] synthase II
MAGERPRFNQAGYAERAKDLGVEREPRERQRVFVTGIAQRGPLGDTFQTSEGLFEGKSGIVSYNVENWRAKVAGRLPEEYDPYARLHPNDGRERDGVTKLQAMTIEASREAARMAGLIDPETGLIPSPPNNPDRIAIWVASGVADTPFIAVDVYNTIVNSVVTEKDKQGEIIRDNEGNPITRQLSHTEGSKRVSPKSTLPLFPEEINASVAVALGGSGWGGTAYQACAGGSAAIVEGARLIQEDLADIVIAGGVEEPIGIDPNDVRGKLTLGSFAAFRALSDWDGDPAAASRPFDKDRSGFVASAGAGIVILESERHLKQRQGKAYAEVLGFANSMDGKNREKAKQLMTELNPKRVARTIFDAITPEGEEGVYEIDAAFVHATSTPIGDKLEAQALESVFGEDLRYIPATAIKSMLGHLLGAAGAANIVNAVIAMREGRMPRILNLDNPDPEIAKLGMEFVRDENLYLPMQNVLTLAYGFGGYNSVLLLGQPPSDLGIDYRTYNEYKNTMLQRRN